MYISAIYKNSCPDFIQANETGTGVVSHSGDGVACRSLTCSAGQRESPVCRTHPEG